MNAMRTIYLVAEHTSTFPGNTGIQRVTRGVARALVDCGVRVTPVRLSADAAAFVGLSSTELEHFGRWNGPDPRKVVPDLGALERNWLLIPELISAPGLPSMAHFIELAHNLGMKAAVVFYDAIPYKMRELYTVASSEAHANYMRALADADLVFPISVTSGEDLQRFLYGAGLRNASAPLATIRPCLLPGEFQESPRVITQPPAPRDRVRILTVSTIEPRKNHLTLIEAFHRAAGKLGVETLELTLVGGCHHPDLKERVKEAIARGPGRVRLLEEVGDSELARHYEQADFTVYPSPEEGFGLPIVESIWHGRVAVCHDRGALAEAAAGGCLKVDITSVEAVADAIVRLASDERLRERLTGEALTCELKTWKDYGNEILAHMDGLGEYERAVVRPVPAALRTPVLSICVTTYNRARWLAHSLPLILEQARPYGELIEVIVCDNASTDSTGDVVRSLAADSNLKYYRNEKNVGMLGNLGATCNHANGEYVWVIGDDDLVIEGAIERILSAIARFPQTALLYMNYTYTKFDRPEELADTAALIRSATPVSTQFRDEAALQIATISTKSENCFTAIYCLVFRREHARAAYGMDMTGAPFSTLATCVPTAEYICRNMFGLPGYWIGDPCVTVNLNVSWMRYASLFILERFPEIYELMEAQGASPAEVDGLRTRHLPHVMHWFGEIYTPPEAENLKRFSVERLVRRFRGVPAFQRRWPEFSEIFRKAYSAGLAGTGAPSPAELERIAIEGSRRLSPDTLER